MDASMGDYGVVSPLITLAIIILGITVFVTFIFSLMNLASDSKKLKKALISCGLFLVVVGVAFVLSDGVETPLKDGKVLSASNSRWVGTGIRTFYILTFVAFASMIFSGAKKILKK
ncbi:MAG: hypothetical protein CMC79_04030 [Flavobacteriaceae bacterium]|nr:hypothetical protein [Flavobacteriaceae bacterium]